MENWPVSLAETKEYLRIDGGEEDGLIVTLIAAAKGHCEDYLKTNLPEPVPTPVKHAILILSGHFYERRDGGDIPKAVYALLAPYRKTDW